MKRVSLKKISGISTAVTIALTAGTSMNVPAADQLKLPKQKEYLITREFAEWQGRPSRVAMGGGKWVLVWVDASRAVMVQRYNTIPGEPLGSPVKVADAGVEPAVAMDSNGDFAVVWKELYDNVISARRFSAEGVQKEADPIPIAGDSIDSATEPTIAMDADGDFVVAWNSSYEVMARRFDSSGVGGAPVIVEDLDGSERPAIAMHPDGDFVVGWKNSSNYQIYVKRFDVSGENVEAGQPIPVSVNEYENDNPSIAMDENGEFVVGWARTETVTVEKCFKYDGEKYCDEYDYPVSKIFARRFDGAGAAKEGEIQVSSEPKSTSVQAVNPVVAMDRDGDFVVGWNVEDTRKKLHHKECSYGECYKYFDYLTYSDVFVQRFQKITGNKSGKPKRVSSSKKYHEGAPQIAMNPEGNFVVAWDKNGFYSAYGYFTSKEAPEIKAKFFAK